MNLISNQNKSLNCINKKKLQPLRNWSFFVVSKIYFEFKKSNIEKRKSNIEFTQRVTMLFYQEEFLHLLHGQGQARNNQLDKRLHIVVLHGNPYIQYIYH
jgi:hypothetical protein